MGMRGQRMRVEMTVSDFCRTGDMLLPPKEVLIVKQLVAFCGSCLGKIKISCINNNVDNYSNTGNLYSSLLSSRLPALLFLPPGLTS